MPGVSWLADCEEKANMRRILLTLLIVFAATHTACSYLTDFVVVNDSGQTVEVRYRVKESRPLVETGTLAKKATSQLRNEGVRWQELTTAQYQLDQGSRLVTVRVMPGESLRIAIMHHYTGVEDPSDVEDFPVEEITVVGAVGELKFTGQQVLKPFSKVSRVLYTLTYK